MTLSLAEWIEVTENLPACIIRDDLIDRVDNAYNGHRMADPLSIDLGNHERALVAATRTRNALGAYLAMAAVGRIEVAV